MNKKYRWKVSSLLSGALALLGFAGCSGDGDDFPEQPSLYGAPVNTMDYRVLGMVTDEDGKPLKDIQVIIDNPRAYVYLDENEKPYGRDSITNKLIPDTTYTDKDGKFASPRTIAMDDKDLVVALHDIDGEANDGDFLVKRLISSELGERQVLEKKEYYTKYEYSKTIQLKRNPMK